MDSQDPVKKVLLNDLIIELILEYAASGEKWNWSRNLRCVSKLWRSRSFKGLCQSTHLPAIHIDDDIDYDTGDLYDIQNFQKRFPKPCPDNISLPKPMLPIKLVIQRVPNTEEFQFIREAALHIASVRVEELCLYTFEELKNEEPSKYNFSSALQLPNMRSFYVDWLNYSRDPVDEIFDLFRRSSTRLTHVEYNYHQQPLNLKPPPNLTHISYSGSVLDLQNLLRGTIKKLTGIELGLIIPKPVPSNAQCVFDCATLNEIAQDYCKTLRELKIMRRYDVDLSGAFEVSLFENLKLLETEVPVCFKLDENSPVTKFNLKHLEYTIKYCPQNVSAAFESVKVCSGSLEYLGLNWNNMLHEGDPNYTAINKECEDTVLREVEQEIPFCSQLKELKIFKIPYRVGIAMMPKVYQSMVNLTSLSLHFERSLGQTRSVEEDDRDLFEILTGWNPEEVPTDELMWPMFLSRQKRYSIASLKNLRYLEVEAPKELKCEIGRFIFRAGFMQMPKLWSINVKGGIIVDPDMIKEWNDGGGVIRTDYSQTDQYEHYREYSNDGTVRVDPDMIKEWNEGGSAIRTQYSRTTEMELESFCYRSKDGSLHEGIYTKCYQLPYFQKY